MIDQTFIKEHGLKKCLEAFKGAQGKGENFLLEEFEALALKILYGGYIQVGEYYNIYPIKIEFYYHEEFESKNQIKDPIVYHRNGRFPGNGHLPPYPMMSLHSHWSGFDIAFEDPEGKYRASVLVRDYIVFDRRKRCFIQLKTSKLNQEERTDQDGWRREGYFIPADKPFVISSPMFLHYFLNGFSLDGQSSEIKWNDISDAKYGEPKKTTRLRVFKDPERTIKDTREWSFIRKDLIDPIYLSHH